MGEGRDREDGENVGWERTTKKNLFMVAVIMSFLNWNARHINFFSRSFSRPCGPKKALAGLIDWLLNYWVFGFFETGTPGKNRQNPKLFPVTS